MALIMAVDDEKPVLEMVQTTLESSGHEVRTYPDPANALAALLQPGAKLPDLLILDVMMPGIDGVEFHKRLQENPRTKGLRTLILTAHPRFEPRFVGAAGVVGFVTRPFPLEVLRKTVNAILGIA